MKTLLLTALLLTASAAHAEKYLVMQNKVGGKIVLTAEPCPTAKSLRRMYASAPNQRTLLGCWTVMAEEVHVKYDDGELYTYPADWFRLIDTEAKQ